MDDRFFPGQRPIDSEHTGQSFMSDFYSEDGDVMFYESLHLLPIIRLDWLYNKTLNTLDVDLGVGWLFWEYEIRLGRAATAALHRWQAFKNRG